MATIARLSDIIDRGRSVPTSGIKRYHYQGYKMDVALGYFERIGKTIKDNYKIDRDNIEVIKQLIRWAQGDPAMMAQDPETEEWIPGDLTKGIYLAGATGTGKTTAMKILAEFTKIDDVKFVRGNSISLLTYPCISTGTICDFYQESGALDMFIKMPVICFNDLGSDSEHKETLYMGTRIKVMRKILQERGDDNTLITHITSNLPINDPDTYELYEDRVVSRIHKMCNYLVLSGPDRWKL